MQHTSPLRKGRWRGDCLYQTLCTIYICSKVNAYFYLLPSLKLTNFLVVKTPMLPPNVCDRSRQVVGYSQICKSRTVMGDVDFQ